MVAVSWLGCLGFFFQELGSISVCPLLLTDDFHIGCGVDVVSSIHLTCVGTRIILGGVLDGHSMLQTNDINSYFSSLLLQDSAVLLPGDITLFVELTGQVHGLALHTCGFRFQFFHPFNRQL